MVVETGVMPDLEADLARYRRPHWHPLTPRPTLHTTVLQRRLPGANVADWPGRATVTKRCFREGSKAEPTPMSNVTRILGEIEAGDPRAAERLFAAVYDELRQMAAAQMVREKPGHTLDATALVHEAYLRLVGDQHFANRRHFFAACAEAMRRILVESARRRSRLKRGGERVRVDLDATALAPAAPDAGLLAVDEALSRLAEADPTAAELVKLRYFAGLSIPQAAEALGIGARSADRLWAYARAWLRDALGGT